MRLVVDASVALKWLVEALFVIEVKSLENRHHMSHISPTVHHHVTVPALFVTAATLRVSIPRTRTSK